MFKLLGKKIILFTVVACLLLSTFTISTSHASNTVIDVENLKYSLATNQSLIYNLANLANAFGFAWCGGTKSPYVGDDFSVSKSGQNYIIQANYNSSDPYAGGYAAENRLRITLSNFRYAVNPGDVTFGTPTVKNFSDPGYVKVAGAFTLDNHSTTSTDTLSHTFAYSYANSVSHTSTYSFTEGIKLGISAKVGVPNAAEVTKSFEFNFSASQGWSDMKQYTETTTVQDTYTGSVPPNSRRYVEAVLTGGTADIPYTAKARLMFDVTFHGFLRWGGNARNDHPDYRPTVDWTFGAGVSEGNDGVLDLLDKYDHRSIPGYATVENGQHSIDWDWIQNNGYMPYVDNCMNYLRTGLPKFDLTGYFTGVNTTGAVFNAHAPVPLPAGDPISGPYSALIEAESQTLSGGANVNTNHGSYSGTGFVDGYYGSSTAQTSFNVNVPNAGNYNLKLRYSAGHGTCTNVGLYVNGIKIKNITCKGTGNWETWSTNSENVPLLAGQNIISYKAENPESSLCINLDYLYVASSVQLVEPSIAGWWLLNEQSGNIAYSNNSASTNGSVANPSWSSDGPIYGMRSLSCNGSTAVSMGAPVTTNTDNIIMSAWFKPNSSSGSQFIVYNGNTSSQGYGIELENGKLAILCGGVGWARSNYAVAQNVWNHVVAKRENGVWTMYLNGCQLKLDSNPAPNPITSGNTTIGSNHILTENFIGNISDVSIIN